MTEKMTEKKIEGEYSKFMTQIIVAMDKTSMAVTNDLHPSNMGMFAMNWAKSLFVLGGNRGNPILPVPTLKTFQPHQNAHFLIKTLTSSKPTYNLVKLTGSYKEESTVYTCEIIRMHNLKPGSATDGVKSTFIPLKNPKVVGTKQPSENRSVVAKLRDWTFGIDERVAVLEIIEKLDPEVHRVFDEWLMDSKLGEYKGVFLKEGYDWDKINSISSVNDYIQMENIIPSDKGGKKVLLWRAILKLSDNHMELLGPSLSEVKGNRKKIRGEQASSPPVYQAQVVPVDQPPVYQAPSPASAAGLDTCSYEGCEKPQHSQFVYCSPACGNKANAEGYDDDGLPPNSNYSAALNRTTTLRSQLDIAARKPQENLCAWTRCKFRTKGGRKKYKGLDYCGITCKAEFEASMYDQDGTLIENYVMPSVPPWQAWVTENDRKFLGDPMSEIGQWLNGLKMGHYYETISEQYKSLIPLRNFSADQDTAFIDQYVELDADKPLMREALNELAGEPNPIPEPEPEPEPERGGGAKKRRNRTNRRRNKRSKRRKTQRRTRRSNKRRRKSQRKRKTHGRRSRRIRRTRRSRS